MLPPESDLIVYRRKAEGPYRIRWIYADGVEGVTLGADLVDGSWDSVLGVTTGLTDPDHQKITRLLGETSGVTRDAGGYRWEQLSLAEDAIRAARKLFWGSVRPSPLPYEEQALCSGWTPPKGWMPRKK